MAGPDAAAAGDVGRGPRRAPGRGEPLPAAGHRIAAAFDTSGRILGLRDDVVHDNGAYCPRPGIIVPELTVAMLPGPYRIPAYRGRVRRVLDQQDPVRHVPGARPVRGQHRARAAARRGRAPAKNQPRRNSLTRRGELFALCSV